MRFVQPETVDLTLPNGDWIRVKKELSVGEDKVFRSRGLKRMSGSGGAAEIDVDWSLMALAKVEAYLVDWSAKDAKGQPVRVTRQTIEALSTDDFQIIDQAIEAHVTRMEQEKKDLMPSVSETPT